MNEDKDFRRTERITFLANTRDAKIIEDAANDARMTVSTFVLWAALEKSKGFVQAHCPHEWQDASTGSGDCIEEHSVCLKCGATQ
jgi:uncharacterized protein (DUF1778 family)